MAEWIIERGIGETRAAMIEDNRIVEMRIARDSDGVRFGDICDARLTTKLSVRRGIVTMGNEEALLEPLPAGVTEGGLLRVEVVREAIPERGRPRLAKVRAAGVAAALSRGPELAGTAGGAGDDRLEAAGWSEAIDAAMSGRMPFAGGVMTISPTPAMTLIDIDGDLPPGDLAPAGARAAAAAICKFDIGGSIGVDLPTVGDKSVRKSAAEIFDALLPQPFERTAVNGFGFIQIVRPRRRASIIERVQGAPVETAALALLRHAARAGGAGRRTLTAGTGVAAWIGARPALVAALEARLGAPVTLVEDRSITLQGGHVHAAQV